MLIWLELWGAELEPTVITWSDLHERRRWLGVLLTLRSTWCYKRDIRMRQVERRVNSTQLSFMQIGPAVVDTIGMNV